MKEDMDILLDMIWKKMENAYFEKPKEEVKKTIQLKLQDHYQKKYKINKDNMYFKNYIGGDHSELDEQECFDKAKESTIVYAYALAAANADDIRDVKYLCSL